MQVQAAIFREPHTPLSIETVDLDTPQSHEVLVRTVASGVCHSDLHVIDGNMRASALTDASMVLGHEGAGIVEAVGGAVTYVKPGDHVVACLSGFCGTCEQCLSGHPNLCQTGYQTQREGNTPRISQNGQRVGQLFSVASFAEGMLLHENSIVKIDDDLPLDKAALVGCGVLTGVGAALRTSGLQAGQTVAVFGCGARASAAPSRSSLSISSTPSWRWRSRSAPPTPSTPRTMTQSPPSAPSPTAAASTTPSRR
jgi:S-(hydroxymethyl)glutathione dehydrogenase/alcohol dehydrogenase